MRAKVGRKRRRMMPLGVDNYTAVIRVKGSI
jgi:hypothetical protein